MHNATESVSLGNALDTIAQLQPLIDERSATARQKHAYWDALDTVKRHQQEASQEHAELAAPTMSYVMTNPVYFADLGKVFIAVGGAIILIALVVCIGGLLASSLS